MKWDTLLKLGGIGLLGVLLASGGGCATGHDSSSDSSPTLSGYISTGAEKSLGR